MNSLGEDDLVDIKYKGISLKIQGTWKILSSLSLVTVVVVLVVSDGSMPFLLLLLLLLEIESIASVRW